jgi:DNA-binding XRE family transcriptional regulator
MERTELSPTQAKGLRKARKHTGVTQGEAADLLNCNQRTISNWETDDGTTIPDAAISTLLGYYWFQNEEVEDLYRDHDLYEFFDRIAP